MTRMTHECHECRGRRSAPPTGLEQILSNKKPGGCRVGIRDFEVPGFYPTSFTPMPSFCSSLISSTMPLQ